MNDLTVAIVTRNRPERLKRCLDNFVKQTKIPKIIIIDNDPKQSAFKASEGYTTKLNITYKCENIKNVPRARNLALTTNKSDYLGFTDDDCVLDKHWAENGLKTLHNNSQVAYAEGRSLLFNKNNIFAQTLYLRQDYWFRYKLDSKTGLTTPYNLDTKNVIFRVKILEKYKLKFDELLYLDTVGDHADMDLGFQLNRFKYTGIFDPEMIVYHEEIETLSEFTRKAYQRGRVGMLLYQKWNLQNELTYLPDIKIIKFIRRLKCWPEDYRRWTKNAEGGFVKRFSILFLMKLYDRIFLQGFADEAARRGLKLNFSDKSDA